MRKPVKKIVEVYMLLSHGSGVFTVTSPKNKQYMVDMNAGTCTCPDFIWRSERRDDYACKHISLVRERVGDFSGEQRR